MDRVRRELLPGAALAEEEDMRVGLRGEPDALTHPPHERGLAEDADRVGVAEATPVLAREEAGRRHERRSLRDVEHELAPQRDDVAGADLRRLDALPVHLERALADAV